MESLKLTTLSELSKKYKYFIFDCDGVLWHTNQQIGNAFNNVKWL